MTHYTYKDIREVLEDHWIPTDGVSEESADYLFSSCGAARMIVYKRRNNPYAKQKHSQMVTWCRAQPPA